MLLELLGQRLGLEILAWGYGVYSENQGLGFLRSMLLKVLGDTGDYPQTDNIDVDRFNSWGLG